MTDPKADARGWVANNRGATASAAVAIAVLVLTQVASHTVPLGTVLAGALYGSLNGLLAVGLVLTFRVTRAINFSYGAMGGLPAGIAASLFLAHGLPWFAAVPLALLLGAVVGLAVGALIQWRFANSPRLVLTVATIGLAQLLGGIALYVPRWFDGPSLITNFQTGLSDLHFSINPVLFDGNDLLAAAVVPFVAGAVAWFLLRTDAGRAVRAIADNPDRARLVGIPTRRLLLGVWTLSGVVAALAVMLQAPRAGVPLDAAAGPAILLAPLAAAVVARMESLLVAFLAAIGLGVLEEVVRLNVSKQALQTLVFLAVILIALLLQHRSDSRAELADESSWSAAGALQPIPAALRALPEVRGIRIAAVAIGITVALSLPAFLSSSRLDQVSVGLVYGLAALSLVVLSGWTGTTSLGQFALVGVGAVVAGDLMMRFNLDFFLSMALAGAAGALAAVVLGLPALRVRGQYLAVTTLAFAVAANDFFFNPTNYADQLPSSVLRPVLWKRFSLQDEGDLYLVCLGVLALAVVLIAGLRKARPGRAILATRDNRRAAEAASVPTTRTQLMAFAISGVLAGIAGALYVVILGSAGFQTFPQPTASPCSRWSSSAACPRSPGRSPASHSSSGSASSSPGCKCCSPASVCSSSSQSSRPGLQGSTSALVTGCWSPSHAAAASTPACGPMRPAMSNPTQHPRPGRSPRPRSVPPATAIPLSMTDRSSLTAPRSTLPTASSRCSSGLTWPSARERSSPCSARTAPGSRASSGR